MRSGYSAGQGSQARLVWEDLGLQCLGRMCGQWQVGQRWPPTEAEGPCELQGWGCSAVGGTGLRRVSWACSSAFVSAHVVS